MSEKETHHQHHVIPLGVHFATFAALLILMFLTVWIAHVHMATPIANTIAMAIAVLKATLVVLFFMGVKYSTRLTKMWAAIGFLWLAVLFGTLFDYWSRPYDYKNEGWTPTDPGSATPWDRDTPHPSDPMYQNVRVKSTG